MDYNILDYGARSGDLLQTAAIQGAIDACFLAGGGRVVIPAGNFLTGSLRLRSNVELHLCSGAYLEGSRDPEDYHIWQNEALEPVDPEAYATRDASTNPFSRWSNALIKAFRAKNIAVTGEPGSFLDGCDCYDAQGEEGYRGPHLMNFHECENVTLRGYTIRRSANWAHAIFHSQNITIDGITVYAGHDGIDIRTCDHVLIQNCTLITGDDCVAGYDDIDVHVRDCYCESATQIFRLGGTGILIERIRSKAPAGYGFRGSLTKEERAASAPPTQAAVTVPARPSSISAISAPQYGRLPATYWCVTAALSIQTPCSGCPSASRNGALTSLWRRSNSKTANLQSFATPRSSTAAKRRPFATNWKTAPSPPGRAARR